MSEPIFTKQIDNKSVVSRALEVTACCSIELAKQPISMKIRASIKRFSTKQIANVENKTENNCKTPKKEIIKDLEKQRSERSRHSSN